MTSRTRLLAILLGALSIVAGVQYAILLSQPEPRGMEWQREMSAEFERQWATIAAADKIVDKVERCKRYPDAPWLHWKPELVTAFCDGLALKAPSFAEIKAVFQDDHPELLEQKFQSYQDANLSDPNQRGLLGRAMGVFAVDDPEVGAFVDKWISLAPHSRFALLARGILYVRLAYDARGSDTRGNTSQDNFRRMHELMAKGRADLEAALAADPKLITAYVELIRLGPATGDRELIEYAARAALAVDPTDVDVYLMWMRACQPRWGGSMWQMQEVAKKAAEHLDRNPRLALIMEKPVAYPATLAVDMRNADLVMRTLDTALQISPSVSDFEKAGDTALMLRQPERAIWYFSQAWRFSAAPLRLARRAAALAKLGKRELAMQSLPESIDLAELDESALADLAHVYWDLGMLERTEHLFDVLIERNPHSRYAMSSLSSLYLTPPKRTDKAREMVTRLLTEYPNHADGWYYDFVLKYPNKQEYDKSARKFLELVNRDDPYEQERIKEAMLWLGQKQ